MNKKELLSTDLLHKTDKLRKLFLKNPDLPLLILATEDANDGEYCYEAVWNFTWEKGEFLDCVQGIKEDKIYVDRDEFETDLEIYLWDNERYENLSEDEFEILFGKELAKYEPYWTPCLILYIG